MYSKPSISDIGSLQQLTLSTIHKNITGTDTVIYSDGTTTTIPGDGATVS